LRGSWPSAQIDPTARAPHRRLAHDQDIEAPGSRHRGIYGSETDAPVFRRTYPRVTRKNGWRYIGNVGTGFSHETLEELHGKLIKFKSAKSPFAAKVKDEAVTTWVKPKLVAEVKFTEWTTKGQMRHPVYLGLRISARLMLFAKGKHRAGNENTVQLLSLLKIE
jgi:hypothetical protein